MVKITKVLGIGKTPPPLCWEKFPNNPVFFSAGFPNFATIIDIALWASHDCHNFHHNLSYSYDDFEIWEAGLLDVDHDYGHDGDLIEHWIGKAGRLWLLCSLQPCCLHGLLQVGWHIVNICIWTFPHVHIYTLSTAFAHLHICTLHICTYANCQEQNDLG